MPQSNALAVISTSPAVADPVTPALALIPNFGDRIIQNGPGMHLNLAFSAGGVYVEAALRGVAELLEFGPVPVVKAVEAVFADDAQRIAILDELFLLRAPPPPADENSVAQPQAAPKASKTVVKLKKLCRKLLKFTDSSELPDTQLLAYKGIAMLTTHYIGLRFLFIEQLPFKHSARQLSKGAIVRAWRDGSSGDPEWEFWIEFAAYCVASPDDITVIVETQKPSAFGCFEGAQCVSERLSHWISSALTANDESRRLAVRYLAGILELPSFWDFRIKNDLHSASDGVCLISIRLLEDLAVECEEHHFTLINDLVTLDPEGINMLIFATLNRLPLKLLPDDDMRSTTSLEIAERLIQRLQTERSKVLFPEASKRAERFLPKPETAPDIEEEMEKERVELEEEMERQRIEMEKEKERVELEDEIERQRIKMEKQIGGGKLRGILSSMLPKRRRGPSLNPLSDDQVVPKKIRRALGNDMFIAVMGLTGTGKSSFVNMAVGSTASPLSDGLESATDEIQEHRCGHPHDSGRSIVFIDTPGIGGRYKTAMDVLWAISGWLTDEYQGNVLLTGILFMHRITDNRMPGGETSHMRTQLFQALCGRSDLRNVVLVPTMSDQLTKEIVTKRVADLQENFWKMMIDYGSRVDSSYCHTPQSAWDILNQFEELRPPQNNQS